MFSRSTALLFRSFSGYIEVVRKTLFIFLLFLISSGAWACSCAKESAAERYEHASSIVRARVVATSLHKNPRAKDEAFNPEIVLATLQVLETLKGGSQEFSQVEGGANYRDPVCNIALATGGEYLFVLSERRVVSVCNSWFLDGSRNGDEMLKKFRALRGTP